MNERTRAIVIVAAVAFGIAVIGASIATVLFLYENKTLARRSTATTKEEAIAPLVVLPSQPSVSSVPIGGVGKRQSVLGGLTRTASEMQNAIASAAASMVARRKTPGAEEADMVDDDKGGVLPSIAPFTDADIRKQPRAAGGILKRGPAPTERKGRHVRFRNPTKEYRLIPTKEENRADEQAVLDAERYLAQQRVQNEATPQTGARTGTGMQPKPDPKARDRPNSTKVASTDSKAKPIRVASGTIDTRDKSQPLSKQLSGIRLSINR